MSDTYESLAFDDYFEEMEDEFEEDAFDEAFYDAEGYEEMDDFGEFEESDLYYGDSDGYEDGYEAFESLDEAAADALEAEDTDEFIGAIASAVPKVFGFVKRIVQRIRARRRARRARRRGGQRADEGDLLEAFDELVDMTEDEEDLEAAAPVMAALSLRSAVPGIARASKSKRLKLVKAVKSATKKIARRQGKKATKSVPAVVKIAKKKARVTGQPLARAVVSTAAKVARNPAVARKLSRQVTKRARLNKMRKAA